MAHDILLGQTKRDFSVGKSAAELWDEAESARLHRPVHYMSRKAPHPHARSNDLNEVDVPPSPASSFPTPLVFGGIAAVVGLFFFTRSKGR